MEYELNMWLSKLLKATQCNNEHWKKEAMEIVLENIEKLVKDKEIIEDKDNAKTILRDSNNEMTLIVHRTYKGN